MGFCRGLDPLGRFSTKTFLRFLLDEYPSVRRRFYETGEINRIAEITLVFSKVISFYRIDPNLYENISLHHFYYQVLTVTPIETKQEIVWMIPEGGEFQRREYIELDWFNSRNGELEKTGPTRPMESWSWSIELAVGRAWDLIQITQQRVELVDPTRHWLSWT